MQNLHEKANFKMRIMHEKANFRIGNMHEKASFEMKILHEKTLFAKVSAHLEIQVNYFISIQTYRYINIALHISFY